MRFRSVWATRVGLLVLVAALLVALADWTRFGLAFYARVIPFYDSMSYQDGYWSVAQQAAQDGTLRTLISVWKQPNMVVLYKFFAAVFSGVLPPGYAGLYVYLYGIHVAGVLVLVAVTRRATGSFHLGLLAAAAWLAAGPFSELRNGVVDQRMDLAGASFYLLVVALALAWSRTPSPGRALALGTVAALAVLHRPVLAAAIVLVTMLFAGRALLRHRRAARAWGLDALAMAAPGVILAAPWLLAHVADLRQYYFGSNVDVGSATSVAAAADYNWQQFQVAFGPAYAAVLLAGIGWIAATRRIDWLDFGALLVATLVPLALLAASRSSGNRLVPEIPLAIPALLLSCARRTGDASRSEPALPMAVSCLALGLVVVSARSAFARDLQSERATSRPEAEQVIREIAAIHPHARVAAYQAWPVDVVGLVNISRSIGCELSVGVYGFHPQHFGVANDAAERLSPAERTAVAGQALAQVKAKADVLLLPTTDTEGRLLPLPFSHSLIPEMHRLAVHDPAFVHALRTSAIDGMCFDVFEVVRPDRKDKEQLQEPAPRWHAPGVHSLRNARRPGVPFVISAPTGRVRSAGSGWPG